MKNKTLLILSVILVAIVATVVFGLVFLNKAVNNAKLPLFGFVGAPDGEVVYIYEAPNINSKRVGQLEYFYHGLYSDQLIRDLGDWLEIEYGGYVLADQADVQTWYDGTGESVVVAAKPHTYIYQESYDPDLDEESIVKSGMFVMQGTVIADRVEMAGEYYLLMTAHDYLYVHRSDVQVLNRKEFKKLVLKSLF